MTFGDFIKAEREKQGLTIRGVALSAGISPTTLLYIENGQTKDPRLSLVRALLQVLRKDLRALRMLTEWPSPMGKRTPPPEEG